MGLFYKPANRKIPNSAIFCDMDIMSFQTQGIGRIRMITSVVTLGTATPMKYLRE